MTDPQTTESPSPIGHNIAQERLGGLIMRIERLEEERKALGSDIKDIYTEAKSAGFDPKVMRKLIALRKLDPQEIEEQEALLDIYRRALGDFVDLPLGAAAIERVS